MIPEIETIPGVANPLPADARAASEPRGDAGLAPHRLKRVLQYIEARIAEPLQVTELAEQACMSPFHFSRMFKLATGYSPHRYLTLQRMARAKELLATADLPIASVANAVGYRTQAHFTGIFSKHVGTTPHAYRLAHRAPASSGSARGRAEAEVPREGSRGT
jgi:transcriptional regulator GlxA family with amidase domain